MWPVPTSRSVASRENDDGSSANAVPRRVGIERRDRAEQRPRIGVRRTREQRPRVAHLDDPPQIHHRHAAADVLHQPQVVRDEEIRQLQALLQVEQQAARPAPE